MCLLFVGERHPCLPLETPRSDAELSPLDYLTEVGGMSPEVVASFALAFPTLATLDTAKQVGVTTYMYRRTRTPKCELYLIPHLTPRSRTGLVFREDTSHRSRSRVRSMEVLRLFLWG